MQKRKSYTILLFLFLIPAFAFAAVKINPIKIYEAGVKAYESENYKKAIHLFENAIEAGLSGEKLKDVYLKLYFRAVIADDPKKIEYYESKCESLVPGFRPITKAALTDLKETALFLVRSIKDPYAQASWLTQMVGALEEAGNTKLADLVFIEALEIVKSIKSSFQRAHVLNSLASILARAGRTEQALQIARSIKDTNFQSTALRAIVGDLARAGKTEQALQIARSIEDPSLRAQSLNSITSALVRAGKTEQALEIARSIKDTNFQSTALRAIVGDLARAGKTEQALQTASFIKCPNNKKSAFLTIFIKGSPLQLGKSQEVKWAKKILALAY